MTVTQSRWTPIAERMTTGFGEHRWRWFQGHSPLATIQQSDADKVILMHQRQPDGGVLLVARLPGPAWLRWRTWCGRNAIPMRVRR